MDKLTTRLVGAALAESAASTYDRVKIGSVISIGRYILTQGANLSTSHPLQKFWNDKVGRLAPNHCLHSEMHAIHKALRSGQGGELNGARITVARVNRLGSLADCRPCPACDAAIRAYGIQEITYTTPRGIHHEVVQ